MPSAALSIRIGTSGFNYSSWKKIFYPSEVPASKWFEYYCTHFNTVELNNTFYRFPLVKNLKKFYERSPEQFVFSVKAHKIITHTKRMKDATDKVDEFLSVVHEGLAEKTGAVLFQLPPSFKYSDENLDSVLKSVPHNPQHVIEFRHESWWNDNVVNTLQQNQLTFCSVSFPDLPNNLLKTTDVFYLRMHGVPELFKSSYTMSELKNITRKIPAGVKEVFVYFNNTMFEAGFTNALTLQNIFDAN